MIQNGRETRVRARDHLFVQGDRNTHIYLVKSGMLKAYYVRADGRQHIKSFLPEGSIIGSMVALVDHDPCTFNLVAIENGSVIALPFGRLKEEAGRDIGLANILVDFLSAYGKRKERREYELLSLSPDERYSVLLETMPDVADRITQADLAAYIGVTPQALSRIKRRIRTPATFEANWCRS
ncbi:MAG: Crp/Fnr family transcriptional regulator [Sphingopyxis sp.]|uniref:Crp/Fnr family transcriptional regulator n=1 Tax=Sphingopyxis sp. TaxID=1908224 RepID=UPI002ABC2D61|nr:Crp/Fnr family transcriptional regulator [Sphingopyxis sp.]MDZ3832419.1 Crp/Fnr family transcriptional regulator [Sphingopyxis sp.]